MSATPPARAPRARLEAVDALRGAIMVLMALDHTRDFFGVPGQSPTDVARASAALFFTRWVTHFCAPVFALLTGTGACLALRRRSKRELSWFLFTRGLWLIFLEVTVLRCFAYQLNFDYRLTMLVVLWSLGWSMIVLALLVHLPSAAVTATGAVLIAGHDLLDSVVSRNPLWIVLHSRGFVIDTPAHAVFVVYPLVPWVGVTLVGYGLGSVYRWEPARRRALLLRLGLVAIVAFAALRGLDGYGDPSPWRAQPTTLRTALSFLNTSKYPPSLLFLLMTLGPSLLFLWAVDRGAPRLLRPAVVIGKVPLFFYAVHFALIHWLAVVVCFARYGSARWMFESPDVAHYPFSRPPPPPEWGYTLPGIYVVWAGVVIGMYGACAWFAGLKQRRSDAWLSYL